VAAETPNSTNRFELDGVEYEVPAFLDLTISDWELVYDEAGVVLADFGPIAGDSAAEKERLATLKNPRVEKSFLMIAYLRVHPDADVDTAREAAGKAKLIPLLEALAPEDDADDPTSPSQNPRSESSERSRDDSSESSPPASPQSSETPGNQRAPIGISG
jgi:hypothetical protein